MFQEPAERLCYSSLLGQERAKDIIARALIKERVPHAYLFRGPDGVGKKLFARGLAAAINCRNRKGAHACGVCVSCKKLISGNHPDYLVVESEKGAIKIDQVRKVCRELSYPPYESSTRIVVLEDVHTMRREASNSLLKTLEEPPKGNLLILTAESSSEVLSTITSRCQVVSFFGLTEDQTQEILGSGNHLALTHEMSAQDRFILARLAGGSPGKATLLATTSILSVWYQLRLILLDPMYKRESELGAVLSCAEEIASLKTDFEHLLAILRLWIRDHIFVLSGLETESIESWGGREEGFSWSLEDCYVALELLEDVEKKMVYNCNLALCCEVLLFKLLGLR